MSQTYTAKVSAPEVERIRDFLERLGFEFREQAHAHFSARGDGSQVTIYRSGKLVVQGKGGEETWRYLEAMKLGGRSNQPGPDPRGIDERPPRIGGDECGKGDYFGPLVVAACRWSPAVAEALSGSGLQDSKRISDARIPKLARAIRAATQVQVLSLKPETYNRLYEKMGNLNRMLAWAHARVLEDLLEQHPEDKLAVVDKFANEDVLGRALMNRGRQIRVIQEVRGEEDPAVAAASVVARDRFLVDMDRLSEDIGLKLPKGASAVLPTARRVVEMHGREVLERVAKLHFRTTQSV